MKLNNSALLLLLLVATAGCGTTSAEDDPLAGTWSNDSCFGTSAKPADIESCATQLTFSNGLEVELESVWISLSATADRPGCTTTRLVVGKTWSADRDNGTFTISGDGVATLERSNCVNDADNLAAEETSEISLPGGDASFEITGDSLTVETGALKGAYTR